MNVFHARLMARVIKYVHMPTYPRVPTNSSGYTYTGPVLCISVLIHNLAEHVSVYVAKLGWASAVQDHEQYELQASIGMPGHSLGGVPKNKTGLSA